MKKLSGDTKTNLTMTKKAQKFYDDSDPLDIEEIETDDGYRYNITGIMCCENLTEDEVSEALEDFADEINETAIRDIAQNWIENDRTGDYTHREITLDEAETFIGWMDDDDRPDGITPDKFMKAWNEIIRSGRDR